MRLTELQQQIQDVATAAGIISFFATLAFLRYFCTNTTWSPFSELPLVRVVWHYIPHWNRWWQGQVIDYTLPSVRIKGSVFGADGIESIRVPLPMATDVAKTFIRLCNNFVAVGEHTHQALMFQLKHFRVVICSNQRDIYIQIRDLVEANFPGEVSRAEIRRMLLHREFFASLNWEDRGNAGFLRFCKSFFATREPRTVADLVACSADRSHMAIREVYNNTRFTVTRAPWPFNKHVVETEPSIIFKSGTTTSPMPLDFIDTIYISENLFVGVLLLVACTLLLLFSCLFRALVEYRATRVKK